MINVEPARIRMQRRLLVSRLRGPVGSLDPKPVQPFAERETFVFCREPGRLGPGRIDGEDVNTVRVRVN